MSADERLRGGKLVYKKLGGSVREKGGRATSLGRPREEGGAAAGQNSVLKYAKTKHILFIKVHIFRKQRVFPS